MADDRETRRRKVFRALIEGRDLSRYETEKVMAAELGFSPAHFSQMKSGNRPIGNDSADKIEKGLGLPPGTLDRADADTLSPQAALARQFSDEPLDAAEFSVPSVEDWTVEQLMAALAEKLLKEAHPADVEAAPSDLKRIIEKARDPDARIQMSTTRQLLPDRRQANSGRQR